METEEKIKRWKEYLEKLYSESVNGNMLEKEEILDKDDKGKHILQSKFDSVIEYIKNNKATGISEIPIELF